MIRFYQVRRTSEVLLLAACIAACSSSDKKSADPDGGTGGASGSSTGGTGGSGGGPDPTIAVAKFCNELALAGGEDVVLTLNVGTSSFSANSGECTPVPGQLCTEIPTGANVPVSLLDGADTIAEGALEAVGVGEEWLIVATFNDTSSAPEVLAGQFSAEFACQTTDPTQPPAQEGPPSSDQTPASRLSPANQLRIRAQVGSQGVQRFERAR